MTEKSENELKPCPFCGKLDCLHLKVLRSENMSNDDWNHRPIEDRIKLISNEWEGDFLKAKKLLERSEEWLRLFSYNTSNIQDHLNTSNYLLWDIHNFLNECN